MDWQLDLAAGRSYLHFYSIGTYLPHSSSSLSSGEVRTYPTGLTLLFIGPNMYVWPKAHSATVPYLVPTNLPTRSRVVLP